MRQLIFTLLCVTSLPLFSQEKGYLTGSLESNSIYYVKDNGLNKENSVDPDDRFGSNNYLKLDYTLGKFSAGIQLEGYLPTLQGYDIGLYGSGKKAILGIKYASWQDENFAFRVGDIFEQFGSGLVFRSYEDRTLGINNSIEGVNASYNFKNYVSVKGLYGRPRLYDSYADSWIRGADLSLSVSDIIGWNSGLLNLEGSVVNRYEALPEDASNALIVDNLNLYSARLNFDYKGINMAAEYVGKGKDASFNASEPVQGHGFLAEIGYNYKALSVLGTYRELNYMNTTLARNGRGVGNVMNYLPALTRQYTYMLANLNPYQVQGDGERGGQLDIYYSIRSKEDRSKYWNLHFNASMFYSNKNITGKSRLLWRDINADVERQWNRKFKTSLLVSVQEWNPSLGFDDETYLSNIFVLDGLYKFDRKKSIRAELQYLYSQDYEKDWVAALVEFSFAPKWSFSVSDMYNLGTTDTHYYSGSVSYTRKNTRLQLSYGRNRAGYVCSGGVCRYTPAYTGANLTVTSSF